MTMAQLILVLNPGSTSTKAAVYQDERPLLSRSIVHTNQDLAPYPTLYDQLDYRVSLVRSWLAQEGFDLKRLAAVVGRGGIIPNIVAGGYRVDAGLLDCLRHHTVFDHASNLGGLMAAAFAFLIGLPVLRLKSDYLAIATLGFAEIIRSIFQWDKLGAVTNGSNMLRLFPTFNDFNIRNAEGEVTLYFSTTIPFLIAGVCIGLIVLLLHSSYGRAFMSIRDDEIAAEAMGVNLARHKQQAFCISSFFAGVGGAMLAMYQNSVQAKSFTSAMTYEILLIVVIGGIGSVTGSCLSSFLFVACSEWWLRFLDQKQLIGTWEVPLLRNGFRLVVFSIIIMIVVLFFRQGIMGTRELPDLFRKKVQKGGAVK